MNSRAKLLRLVFVGVGAEERHINIPTPRSKTPLTFVFVSFEEIVYIFI